MMNHSPGPWKEKITDDGLVWVLMPDAHRVSIGDMEETCGICHANARLIASAPALLEALETIGSYPAKKFYFSPPDPISYVEPADDMRRIAQAAISQATAQ